MTGIAVIGTGAIAAVHIEAYLSFPDRCRVLALCDLYPGKARALNEKYNLGAAVYGDYREALKRPDIGLVSVCLPPSAHRDAAVAALEAGKHAVVEKPMAASLHECDEMIRAAEKSGRLLSVVAQNRFKAPAMKVKRIIAGGAAGRVLHAAANSLWWRGQSYYDLWWRGTWSGEGGGCTLNHAVHQIDLLRWTIGMPEEVVAVISNANHFNSETEDLSAAVLRYPGGCLAQITASLVSHGEEQELVFQTERARISVPWMVRASRPRENGFPEPDPETERELQAFYDAAPGPEREGHPGQLGNVLAAVLGREPLLVDGREGRATLELIIGIYKSAAERRPVRFPLTQDDPFYRKETMQTAMPRFHEKTKSVDNFTDTAITLGRDVGR